MANYARQLDDQFDQFSQTGTQKRAAIYARVSTLEQAEEGYSIDEQVRVLREMCEGDGYVVHKEYVDRGKSGKNIKGRPALQQLLHDAKGKDFDLVLVWKVNRFSRKTKDLLNIVEELEMRNIVFRSFTERYETETPAGKMQFRMLAVIAEFERDNIAQNVKMGCWQEPKKGRGMVVRFLVMMSLAFQERTVRENSQHLLLIQQKRKRSERYLTFTLRGMVTNPSQTNSTMKGIGQKRTKTSPSTG